MLETKSVVAFPLQIHVVLQSVFAINVYILRVIAEGMHKCRSFSRKRAFYIPIKVWDNKRTRF